MSGDADDTNEDGFLKSAAIVRFASTVAAGVDAESLAFDEAWGTFWDPVDAEDVQ